VITVGSIVLASSPAVGPFALERLAGALRSRAVIVDTPRAEPDVDDYIAAAAEVAMTPDLLVGYSAGGPRLFAVAERLAPKAIVFMDAGLPRDGVAPDSEPAMAVLLARLPVDDEGLLPPWTDWWPPEIVDRLCPDRALWNRVVAECPRLPRAMYSQPIPAPVFDGPCGLLAFGAAYADAIADAMARGWPTRVLDGFTHLAPLVAPELVADELLALGARLLS
jgi:hypothetical protein